MPEAAGDASTFQIHTVQPYDLACVDREDSEHPFDLFHGFYLACAYPCLGAAQIGGRPVVASIRGIDGFEFNDAMSMAVLKQASWITSVSSDSLVRASKLVDLSGRSSLIVNSIAGENVPKWQLAPENSGVVGTISAFRQKKNIPLLATAYSMIDKGLRRKLLLVGEFLRAAGSQDFEAASAFDGLADGLGITTEVERTGLLPHEEAVANLVRMRVFALSSDHEGLPNAILEAAAAGVPIVATAVDGVKDTFEANREALLVEPGDPQALASALSSVLADDSLALALSRGALQASARFTPERERDAYLSLYAKLIGCKVASA
jgi:glycosyltransferase involved in cell wall biosynthesis